MKKFHNTSVLYRYLFSYFSVILFSCSVIGFFLFSASTRELNAVAEKEIENRLSLAAADLENQQSVMSGIALKVRATIYYTPLYREQNKFYEIDLMNDFAKYSGRSPLIDDYFLMYRDESWIFNSTGKCTFAAYADAELNLAQSAALYDKLNAIKTFTVVRPENPLSDWLLFVYPISITPDCSACVCFVTHTSTVKERLTDVSGKLSGPVRVSWGGQTIVSLPGASAGRPAGGKVLAVTSPKKKFSISITHPDIAYKGLDYFLWINIGILILFIIALLGLSSFLAYSNYRPIKELALKYRTPEANAGGRQNEIFSIDTFLKNVLEKQRVSQTHLHEQYLLLKRQQLLLLLNGGYSGDAVNAEFLPDLPFPGQYYCVLAILTQETPPCGPDELCQLIEDLSGEGLTFYAVRLKNEQCYAVLSGLDSETRRDEAVELVSALLETSEIRFSLGVGTLYPNINRLPASLLSALSSCGAPHNPKTPQTSRKLPKAEKWYDDHTTMCMIAAIKQGDFSAAEHQLETFRHTMELSGSSMLMRRFACGDVLNSVIRTTYEMHLPIRQESFSTLLTLQDVAEFCSEMRTLVSEICLKVRQAEKDRSTEIIQNVLTYIEKHAFDYDLSQERVAEHFGLTDNQLYHIIKEGTGNTYKDYLTFLRIRGAKDFLAAGSLTVAETGQRVGYPNVSYFIKTFKRITGYTPAVYKEAERHNRCGK